MRRHLPLLILVFACLSLPFSAGCGGKNGEAISDGPFRAGIVPVRITRSSGMQDGIFGYAGGSGVTGGWIEHPEGVKILHSDFIIDNINLWYQVTLTGNSGSFLNGEYFLKYTTSAGETKGIAYPDISWTVLQPTWRDRPPTWEYESASRMLRITLTQLPVSGKVRYYIRISMEGTNYVFYESIPQENAIQLNEYVSPRTEECEMQVFGDVYENDVLKSRYIHLFTNVILN